MKPKIQISFKRYEKKYLLTELQYKSLLKNMQAYVKPDIYGQTTNCSLYYDTDSWDLIRKSVLPSTRISASENMPWIFERVILEK